MVFSRTQSLHTPHTLSRAKEEGEEDLKYLHHFPTTASQSLSNLSMISNSALKITNFRKVVNFILNYLLTFVTILILIRLSKDEEFQERFGNLEIKSEKLQAQNLLTKSEQPTLNFDPKKISSSQILEIYQTANQEVQQKTVIRSKINLNPYFENIKPFQLLTTPPERTLLPFVHTPKTAGSTFKTILNKFAEKWPYFSSLYPPVKSKIKGTVGILILAKTSKPTI